MRAFFKKKGLIAVMGFTSSTFLSCNQKELDFFPLKSNRKITQSVYMWGNKFSIPQATEKDLKHPTLIPWFTDSEHRWHSIRFGPDFGVALTFSGKLFIWWNKDSGNQMCNPLELKTRNKIIDAQCSLNKVFTLDTEGNVHIWKLEQNYQNSSSTSKEIEITNDESKSQSTNSTSITSHEIDGIPKPGWFSNNRVIQMSVGWEHAVFVTNHGELYCYGNNDYGQCGLGTDLEQSHKSDKIAQKVKFESSFITKAACGSHHTLVLDRDNTVYSFGDDSKIQLLLGDTRSSHGMKHDKSVYETSKKTTVISNTSKVTYKPYERHLQSLPHIIATPDFSRKAHPIRPSDIYCGDEFSIVKFSTISTNKSSDEDQSTFLMCGGENLYGQCGRTLNKQHQTLSSIKLPKFENQVITSCGSNHCLSYSSKGNLYGWGFDSNGQIGSGRGKLINPPSKIDIKPFLQFKNNDSVNTSGEKFSDINGKVTFLTCGFNNSAIILEHAN